MFFCMFWNSSSCLCFRDTQKKYSNILRLARALTSYFYHVVQTQVNQITGRTFAESEKSATHPAPFPPPSMGDVGVCCNEGAEKRVGGNKDKENRRPGVRNNGNGKWKGRWTRKSRENYRRAGGSLWVRITWFSDPKRLLFRRQYVEPSSLFKMSRDGAPAGIIIPSSSYDSIVPWVWLS